MSDPEDHGHGSEDDGRRNEDEGDRGRRAEHDHGGGGEHDHGDGAGNGHGGGGNGDHGDDEDHGGGEGHDHEYGGGHGHGHDHDHGHTHDHDHHAHDVEEVGVAVVTVSTTRTVEDDPAGDRIRDAVEAAGHEVPMREVVDDDHDGIQSVLDGLVRREDVDAVVTTGGTGVTPDDVTVEAAAPLFEKELPGFGELFRRLSYEEVGTKVVGTRAVAGIADGVPVFCLPGSENAARLGIEEVILPEVGHLAGLATRDHGNGDDGDGNDGDGGNDEGDGAG